MAPEACPASAHVPSDDTTRLAQQLTGLRRALSQYANSLHVCDVGPCTTRHRHENEARIAYRAIKSLLATLRRAIALRETVEANDYLRALEAPVDTTSGASSTSDEDPPRRYMYRSDLGFDDELDPAPETAEEDDEDDDIRQWGDFCALLRSLASSLDCYAHTLDYISSKLSQTLGALTHAAVQDMEEHLWDMHYDFRMLYTGLGQLL